MIILLSSIWSTGSVGGCERCSLAMWVGALSCFLVSSTLRDPRSLSILRGGGHLVINIMKVALPLC